MWTTPQTLGSHPCPQPPAHDAGNRATPDPVAEAPADGEVKADGKAETEGAAAVAEAAAPHTTADPPRAAAEAPLPGPTPAVGPFYFGVPAEGNRLWLGVAVSPPATAQYILSFFPRGYPGQANFVSLTTTLILLPVIEMPICPREKTTDVN